MAHCTNTNLHSIDIVASVLCRHQTMVYLRVTVIQCNDLILF